ncbi:DUF2568 domain-containing protein [Leucobacter chromiiresistens]|uniref:4-amino-4-deoxy-L-arabinose transferase n=1 Tax=Leucobacter chromiiresistens TaxID=1079994 RepID=A0A1H0YTR4_9MICO|nr:DUF2568 domain-containing protein [Leucobacter chromiiresistens]SDQ18478.1 Protein of unknown function [Leucobacter chromiiresistens]
MTSSSPAPAPHTARPALQLARGLFQLAAIVIVTVWGFLAWPRPFPGILTGLGLFVLAVLLWALFLSPKPVLRVDRFAQALFELCLIAAAVAALLALGVHWVGAAAFGVAAAAIGFIASSRRG